MILIIGGAYQGKLEFALDKFGRKTEVYECPVAGKPDFEKARKADILNHVERLTKYDEEIVKGTKSYEEDRSEMAGKDGGNRNFADELFFDEAGSLRENLKDSIVIIEDISQGLVPLEKSDRRWREENGRIGTALAGQAEEVYRVFCGMGQKIK